jgi:hypothetical protein
MKKFILSGIVLSGAVTFILSFRPVYASDDSTQSSLRPTFKCNIELGLITKALAATYNNYYWSVSTTDRLIFGKISKITRDRYNYVSIATGAAFLPDPPKIPHDLELVLAQKQIKGPEYYFVHTQTSYIDSNFKKVKLLPGTYIMTQGPQIIATFTQDNVHLNDLATDR